MKKLLIVAAGILVCATGFVQRRAAGESTPAAERSFEFTYEAHVPAPAAGAGDLRVWIPVPASNAYQQISNLKIESSVAYKTTRDAEYGDTFAFFNEKAGKAAFDVKIRFDVARHEHRVALTATGEHNVKADPIAGAIFAGGPVGAD